MTETDIQRYAREIAAVDLDHERNQYTTTLEYRLAHEVVRLLHALQEAHRPPENAEHHPYHWGEMADMAIDAAVRIAQSDTSRCLSCGAWV